MIVGRYGDRLDLPFESALVGSGDGVALRREAESIEVCTCDAVFLGDPLRGAELVGKVVREPGRDCESDVYFGEAVRESVQASFVSGSHAVKSISRVTEVGEYAPSTPPNDGAEPV